MMVWFEPFHHARPLDYYHWKNIIELETSTCKHDINKSILNITASPRVVSYNR